jgi:uncharacterized membrane protein
MQARDVAAGHGWLWIKQGFALFRKAPLQWWVMLGIIIVGYLGVHAVLGAVGDAVFMLVYPVFVAGIMVGCRALERGENLQLRHLFSVFKSNPRPLLTIGALSILAGVVISLILSLVLPVDDEIMRLLGDPTLDPPRAAQWMLMLAVGQLLLSLPLLMAVWFAPALLAFQKMSALHAVRWSFYACLSNIGALTVYGLASFALTLIAAIPAGLGLILLIPTMIASTYTMYHDIFIEDQALQADRQAASS